MEELKEGKGLTHVEVEAYLKRVFLPEWRNWLFHIEDKGKAGLEVMDTAVNNNRGEEPTLTVGVEFYPDGSKDEYHKIIFSINMSLKVELNKEGKPVKIVEEEGELNGVVNSIIVHGTSYNKTFRGGEHKYTREKDKVTAGRYKDEMHSITSTNGSNIILYGTRNYAVRNMEHNKERELYKEHSIKKVESKEDMLRLERLYKILQSDKAYKVSLGEDEIKGKYIYVYTPAIKFGLYVSPNYIITKAYRGFTVMYSKYGANNKLRSTRKEIGKKSGHTIKDIKSNMIIDKFFRNYVIANDLRRKVKLGDKQQK